MSPAKIQYILLCIEHEWEVIIQGCFKGKITSLNHKKNMLGEVRPYCDIKSEGCDVYIDISNVEIQVAFK